MQILVPAAHGSESLETVTLVNVLRRADIRVSLASVEDGTALNMTRSICLQADCRFADIQDQTFDAIILPGGENGARALGSHKALIAKLSEQRLAHRWYGGICAAPALSLSPNGLLDGKQATCHPHFREKLLHFVDRPVVIDGHCMTSQGAGTGLEFALTWVETLLGKQAREQVADAILVA